MKEIFSKDAPRHNGQLIETLFLVASKQVRFKKNREPYLALVLMDRTGTIEAKVWNNVLELRDRFDENDFIRVGGRVQRYNDRYEIVIDRLERALETKSTRPTSSRKPRTTLKGSGISWRLPLRAWRMKICGLSSSHCSLTKRSPGGFE